ncbi:hypothetical protein AHF37_00872 [Paragonimus kellicotti]|nr:hypothetical protein AHF37_00872 [Paragonimus kellicotti]
MTPLYWVVFSAQNKVPFIRKKSKVENRNELTITFARPSTFWRFSSCAQDSVDKVEEEKQTKQSNRAPQGTTKDGDNMPEAFTLYEV